MEKLVEIMLNEGIDEDTIINVISNLMNEEVEEEKVSLSENCFNDIISLVEEFIHELKAPNDETAGAVLNRKANQLRANTVAYNAVADANHGLSGDNKSDFHEQNPSAGTQDRYNTQSMVSQIVNKIGEKGENLSNGAQRLSHWTAKRKGKLSDNTIQQGRGMVEAGVANKKARVENNPY